MVRLALLAVLVVALCAAGPAQANPLTQGVEGTVTSTVQQTSSTVASVTTAAAVPVATAAEPPVAPTARVVRETSDTVARSAQAATQSATAPVAGSPPPPTSSPPAHESSPRALSSTRDRGPVRAMRAGRDRAARSGHRVAGVRDARRAQPQPGAARPVAMDAGGTTPEATSGGAPRDETRGAAAPDRTQGGSAPASGTASAAAGIFVGLLAGALCLAGPRLMRRLSIEPAPYRPFAFVSSLERPG